VRLILLRLLLVILPVLLYLAWRFWRHRRAVAQGLPGRDLRAGPGVWLLSGGLVMAIASLAFVGLTGGEPPGGNYVPPRYEDGKIVPSHTDR
jgi:IS5 family transposase